MEKTVLKDFAIESRKNLIDKMKLKLSLYRINEKLNSSREGDLYFLYNHENLKVLSLTIDEYNKRELLIKRINEVGIDRVIEESAYTWFNRLIAIRYMEIHDYLPLGKNNESLGIRVLSSNDNTPNPEIMKFSNLMNNQLDINFNSELYSNLNNENEKFKYILQLVCNKLKKVFPDVFDGITDYIDLLIPDNMLSDTGFVSKLIREIDEHIFLQVEIIGWLYQFYNQSEKDRVINAKKVYKKFEIPYATQLFTPDWIVKYLVENTLGKYCIEHCNIDNDVLNNWIYFLNENLEKKEVRNVEEIKFIDPCCGSGHILVYAFDIFYQIYCALGYNKNDIAELILKNNLYGLDIDDRAGQLSILSVLLKAREYDKNIFNKDICGKLHVLSLYEPTNINYEIISQNLITDERKNLISKFENIKEIGSLIKIDNFSDEFIVSEYNNIFDNEFINEYNLIQRQAKILSNKYDIVVTNPPYMNDKYMSPILKKFASKEYPDVKADLFSMFFKKCINMNAKNGYIGIIAPYVWMFIKRYNDLRKLILSNSTIDSLVQFEYNAFEVACVPVGLYTLNNSINEKDGIYIKLSDFPGAETQRIKTIEAINDNVDYKYRINSKMFNYLPQNIFAYWLTKDEINMLSSEKSIGDYFDVKGGITTANTNLFLKNWWEVDFNEIGFNLNRTEAKKSNKKWFPYNKGGEYHKWYGNQDFVINWRNDGEDIKNYKLKQRELDPKYNTAIAGIESMFKEQISWSLIGIGNFNVRYYPPGFLFDVSGCVVLPDGKNKNYVMGLLNSKIAERYIRTFNPTMNTTPGDVRNIPFKYVENNIIDQLVEENISLCKEDWDLYEKSWNFKTNKLIEYKENNIENSVKMLIDEITKKSKQLKNNEETLNDIYISEYSLKEILSKEVSEKESTIIVPDCKKVIKDFISYAVGCMFGRYSLDKEGLICTNSNFDKNNYKIFEADIDNIIPISESSDIYYSDDIVRRFLNFIKTCFTEECYDDNLKYIAEQLGRKGTESPEETIRRYFINDFYNDHCKLYQKRPIYWMIDSGKKNGFKALIYIHRYDKQLLSKVRVDYLHKVQNNYERICNDMNYNINNSINIKESQTILNQTILKIDECNKFDEKLGHLANQMIDIDLDDGIKENYEKFADILAKIK